MRKEFMKRIDARESIENYPFVAEEMLLHREFKGLRKIEEANPQKTEPDIESYPFGQEEMLLQAELRELDGR